MAGNSINAMTAKALGISKSLIPEKLRLRLYGYRNLIPDSMLGAAPDSSESRSYEKKTIKDSSETFLRNIVILDTIFDDPKIVKQLIQNKLQKDTREESLLNLKRINAAKLDLLQSMGPMLNDIYHFLSRDNINWINEEIPYPYEDGAYSSPLIAANLAHDTDPSIYDQALSLYYSKSYAAALQVINNKPVEFVGIDTSLLRVILEEKQAVHQEYADYLANFN